MGTILPWPAQRDQAARERFKSEPKGEIVFFTGVRYERAISEPAPVPGAPSAQPAGDTRLEPRRA